MSNAHGRVDKLPASHADDPGSTLSGINDFFLFFLGFFFNKTTWMRVFSQINNCQQKQNKKQKQKTDKTKKGAPLLGLAKSIYYYQHSFHELTSTKSQSWLLELAPTCMNAIPK